MFPFFPFCWNQKFTSHYLFINTPKGELWRNLCTSLSPTLFFTFHTCQLIFTDNSVCFSPSSVSANFLFYLFFFYENIFAKKGKVILLNIIKFTAHPFMILRLNVYILNRISLLFTFFLDTLELAFSPMS